MTFRSMRRTVGSLGLGMALSLAASGVQAETVITYSAWGNADEIAIEQKLIEAFQASHPGIKVELVVPAGNYEEKLSVMIAGGSAPDVITLNRSRYPQFANAVQPINLAGVDRSTYAAPLLLEALTYQGHQLGLPKRMNTKVMIYARDAFNETGVAYPNAAWTPDKYAEAARKLTRRQGDQVIRWGSGPLVIWNWFTAFGGSLFNADMTKAQLTSPEILAATRFMMGLHKTYAAWFDDFANFNEALASGKMAMFADVGPWYVPSLLTQGTFDWVIAPLPGRPLEPELTGLSISRTTAHPEAAREFVTWVSTSPEAQTIIARGTNLPVTKTGIRSFVSRAPGRSLETFFAIFEQPYTFPPLPARRISTSAVSSQIWNTFYNEILLGKVDPLVALNRLQAMAQAYLDEQNARK